ncbi:cation diffusion facilitator family transporter [Octadecabacter sp. 1_MG-2023]|uniref:cation diffusion facilitator family transporter n=1 Tax=unclassified Octadecabacter TaxID=196158 RepID=UPI001C09F971|nr:MULTISPECIES: cation diffusion facilitator family transporter [unclassified Octadecabacter]MBU2992529.1 cation diffusion facilitator family transporter [Octadecabacter sp. B2R22]MDO6734714.1 cation diffusion facilitator family transporter [Octadecabacter sp. 1_MG-2023]
MAHHHTHTIDTSEGDGRLLGAIGVNVGLTVFQIIGGVLSGSLALIADALHNLSDAASLVIAYLAHKIARKPASADMPFGYTRVETVAALVNYTSLTMIGIYLAYEAIWRFFDPQPVIGWLMIVVAIVALLVDAITAWLTYSMSKDSVNIRAAFLHNLADAMGSVAVIVAGLMIYAFGWWLADPIITLMIAAYILWMSLSEMPSVIRTLMLARPEQIHPQTVINTLLEVDGITHVHNAHLWQVNEHLTAFQAHVVVWGGEWADADSIKSEARDLLSSQFGITQITLELECTAHACINAPTFGS